MRLIDAESLIVNMDKGMQGTAREYLKFYQMAVNDEPTAYDVDKVAEQLEQHKKSIIGRKERDILNTVGKTNAKAAVERDIEIVKSGGIE